MPASKPGPRIATPAGRAADSRALALAFEAFEVPSGELLSVEGTPLFGAGCVQGVDSSALALEPGGFAEQRALTQRLRDLARQPPKWGGSPCINLVQGDWPAEAWISFVFHWSGGNSAIDTYGPLELWKNGKPEKILATRTGYYAMRPWKNHQLLALVDGTDSPIFLGVAADSPTYAFKVVPNTPVPALRQRTTMECDDGRGRRSQPRSRLTDICAFDALTSGELFVLGRDCQGTDEALVVERWTAQGGQSQWDVLPPGLTCLPMIRVSDLARPLHAVGPDEAYVALERHPQPGAESLEPLPYLARFDGRTWREIPTDVPEAVYSMAATTRGELWVTTTSGQLWLRVRSGAWKRVTDQRGTPLRFFDDEYQTAGKVIWHEATRRLWLDLGTAQGLPLFRTQEPVAPELLDEP